MTVYEQQKPPFTVSADQKRLDLAVVHDFLCNHSFWAAGIQLPRLRRAIEHSLAFGLYHETAGQVGFARVITDTSSLAYILDVFILPDFRGDGLGQWMMQCILDHPDLAGVRTWRLRSKDSQSFYAKLGFQSADHPEWYMEIVKPDAFENHG